MNRYKKNSSYRNSSRQNSYRGSNHNSLIVGKQYKSRAFYKSDSEDNVRTDERNKQKYCYKKRSRSNEDWFRHKSNQEN
jgi:hypothetical protein